MSGALTGRPRPKQWTQALVQARERVANAPDIVVEGKSPREALVEEVWDGVGIDREFGRAAEQVKQLVR